MPTARNLSQQELIDTAHRWRHLALASDTDAIVEARRHEVELRRRLGTLDASALPPTSRDDETGAGLPLAATDIANQFVIATADASTRSTDALHDLLHDLRVVLAIDIAFVAEFVDDRKIHRYLDPAEDDELPVKAGDAVPLETMLCRQCDARSVERRLREPRLDFVGERILRGTRFLVSLLPSTSFFVP